MARNKIQPRGDILLASLGNSLGITTLAAGSNGAWTENQALHDMWIILRDSSSFLPVFFRVDDLWCTLVQPILHRLAL